MTDDRREYDNRQMWNTYENAKHAFDEAFAVWKKNGKQGPPPPRPVRPHTPGWNPRIDFDAYSVHDDERDYPAGGENG
jgi:hypothetical protein